MIYELHVRGFTKTSELGTLGRDQRGTYAGLIEKIPYLVDLGVTAVELMPVFQFDPQRRRRAASNYWGYQPVSFFAPHHAYSSRPSPLDVLDEFRDMVKALIAPASKSFSTWSTTTPRREAPTARRSAIAGWPTTSITSSRRPVRGTRTTPAAATR